MVNIRVRIGKVKFVATYYKDKKGNISSFNNLMGVARRGE